MKYDVIYKGKKVSEVDLKQKEVAKYKDTLTQSLPTATIEKQIKSVEPEPTEPELEPEIPEETDGSLLP